MAFISYLSIFIVKLTKSMHLVVLPLSLIMSAIFEVESPVTILFVIAFVTLVASSIRNVLFNELQFDVFTILVVKMRQMRET